MHFEIPFLSAILKSCDRLASSEVSLHTWNASWCIANHELIMTYRYGKVTTYDDEGTIITNRVCYFTHINWNWEIGFLRQMTPNLGFFLSEISVKPTTSLCTNYMTRKSNSTQLLWINTKNMSYNVYIYDMGIFFRNNYTFFLTLYMKEVLSQKKKSHKNIFWIIKMKTMPL